MPLWRVVRTFSLFSACALCVSICTLVCLVYLKWILQHYLSMLFRISTGKPISCGTASIKIKITRMQMSLVYSMCSYFHLCCSAKAKNLKGWDNARQIENHFGVLLRRAGQDTRECQVSLAILSASSVCCYSGGNW